LVGIFFEAFAEKSSSFFVGVSFLAGGFSSAWLVQFPILAVPDLEADEAAACPPQMSTLQGTFSSRSSECSTAVLLPKGGLPKGSQARVAASLAGQTGEPKLLPG
jgi:hypothetical protein